ncbi:NAC domain-containing protein [Dioscorea alata]|uniref:NAC domain-containing protein n=1 Tax=Dioscorea alata TaxID=55571 RepID=A0ACB7VC31_DIOAL|nr:NAC domain-containing protein [Dioscorea alata]
MSKDTKNKLPPGFHFFPSEEELVLHFLYNKASHLPCKPDFIPTLDLHYCDPWQLINGKALEGDNQWYFFTYKAEKAEDRVSGDGYWTPVTDDEPVFSGENKVGVKKSLVYCIGEAPEGIKTSWLMHEYHLLDELVSNPNPNPNPNCSRRGSSKKRRHSRMEDKKWVICQVFDTSYGTQDENEMELSCMDEAFLSLDDDDDEISFPN